MSQISPEQLEQFQAFLNLDYQQRLLLACDMSVLTLAPGESLCQLGEADDKEYFLYSGELELCAADGICRVLASGTEAAARAVAHLRPRQYTVKARNLTEVFSVDLALLEAMNAENLTPSQEQGVVEFEAREVASVEEAEADDLLARFRDDLRSNRFVLPTLPEVAQKVRKVIDSASASADQIAREINGDPAMAAKLIRAANSPIYHGSAPVDNTRAAIVRLGETNTRQLVLSFSVRDLFNTESRKLNKLMQKTWLQSVEVAAISFVLANRHSGGRFNPEEVMLAGLLNDIGVVAILRYLEGHAKWLSDDHKLAQIIGFLRAEAGAAILEHWHFPQEFIDVVNEVEHWQREHDGPVDLVDLVQVAKLHSYICNLLPIPVASIGQLPAFGRLNLGAPTPELTIDILAQARDDINQAKQILAA